MMWKDVIELESVSEEERDSIGEIVDSEPTRATVLTNKKSIRQSEFYQAAAAGLKPDCVFIIRSSEYNGAQFVVYESDRYKIIRTYEVGPDLMELTCERVVHG